MVLGSGMKLFNSWETIRSNWKLRRTYLAKHFAQYVRSQLIVYSGIKHPIRSYSTKKLHLADKQVSWKELSIKSYIIFNVRRCEMICRSRVRRCAARTSRRWGLLRAKRKPVSDNELSKAQLNVSVKTHSLKRVHRQALFGIHVLLVILPWVWAFLLAV